MINLLKRLFSQSMCIMILVYVFFGCGKVQVSLGIDSKTDTNITNPRFSFKPGSYHKDLNLEFICDTQGADIFYTKNGTYPTLNSIRYAGAIRVDETNSPLRIRMIAVKNQQYFSDLVDGEFIVDYLQVINPVIDPVNSTQYKNFFITISCATPGATIYYTLDGKDPTHYSLQYTNPIPITGDGTRVTVKAFAAVENSEMMDSAIVLKDYHINYDTTGLALWGKAIWGTDKWNY